MANNIYLTGFMGSGKSAVGRLLATRLGRAFIDLDEIIEEYKSMSINDIFSTSGEEHFRELERGALIEVSHIDNCVIALGGGSLIDPENLNYIEERGKLIWLKASFDEIKKRVAGDDTRPLFDEEKIKYLYGIRAEGYINADVSVDTDGLTLEETVNEIENYLSTYMKNVAFNKPGTDQDTSQELIVSNESGTENYTYFLSDSLKVSLKTCLPTLFSAGGKLSGSSRCVIVSTFIIKTLYGRLVEGELSSYGVSCTWFVINSGEMGKSFDTYEGLCVQADDIGLSRDSFVVSLGGGCVGDVAGFFASTYCRGIDIIHIPTTLISLVDSSIGGKNGINIDTSKNKIGTFHNPVAIIAGMDVLNTLHIYERVNGFAEVIKACIVGDPLLFEYIEDESDKADIYELLVDNEFLMEMIKRSVKVKIGIVEEDEKEKNVRTLLNLGHTFGHALESYSNYEGISHGMAIAIGTAVASKLALDKEILSSVEYMRIMRNLSLYDVGKRLHVYLEKDNFIGEIIRFMGSDKKVLNNRLRLVLPKRIGECFVSDEYTAQDLVNAGLSLAKID